MKGTLHRGMIVTVSSLTHTDDHAFLLQKSLIVLTCVRAATIRMVEQSSLWTARSDRAMAWALGEKLLFSHQTSDSFPSAFDPLVLQLCMHPWAAIHAAIGLEDGLYLFSQLSIFSAVPAGRALRPGIIPAHRYFQHPAHEGDRIFLPMLRNELISHGFSREKMLMAFFI